MSRTIRRENPRPYAKESKPYRKPVERQRRHADNQAVRCGLEPERHRKTSGWLTW